MMIVCVALSIYIYLSIYLSIYLYYTTISIWQDVFCHVYKNPAIYIHTHIYLLTK